MVDRMQICIRFGGFDVHRWRNDGLLLFIIIIIIIIIIITNYVTDVSNNLNRTRSIAPIMAAFAGYYYYYYYYKRINITFF